MKAVWAVSFLAGIGTFAGLSVLSDPLPPDATYRPLPTLPFAEVKARDEAAKPKVMSEQQQRLEVRYDLGDKPLPGQFMSGHRRPIQQGVRVRLPHGASWDDLARMSPDEIKREGKLPQGFKPFPHVKQATGGQVFPQNQITEIARQEQRNLERFDVGFDLPDHFTPEFPPPIFL